MNGNIETDHNVICLIPEYMAKHFTLPDLIIPAPVTFREVLENDTTTRDMIFLNGLGMKKVKS